jgi:hypothetical protein
MKIQKKFTPKDKKLTSLDTMKSLSHSRGQQGLDYRISNNPEYLHLNVREVVLLLEMYNLKDNLQASYYLPEKSEKN